jgi:hypothetical protein
MTDRVVGSDAHVKPQAIAKLVALELLHHGEALLAQSDALKRRGDALVNQGRAILMALDGYVPPPAEFIKAFTLLHEAAVAAGLEPREESRGP